MVHTWFEEGAKSIEAMQNTITVSVPGTFVLFGEHAVLEGGHAIAFATDKRITVTLTPRKDRRVTIQSDLGSFDVLLDEIAIAAPFQFVFASIVYFRDFKDQFKDRLVDGLADGFDLKITSEFSDQVGLGSSAAITVAMVAALYSHLNLKKDSTQLFNDAKNIVLLVQGIGSGLDVAASIWGGVILFRSDPFLVEKLSVLPDLKALYSGSKMPTVKVIEWLAEKKSKSPSVYKHLLNAIDACSLEAYEALKKEDWNRVGELMNLHHEILKTMGLTNETIDSIVGALKKVSTVQGIKLSGAGLGDSVLALGSLDLDQFILETKQLAEAGVREIPIQVSSAGVLYE